MAMKKILCVVLGLGLLLTSAVCDKAFSFDEITLPDVNSVAVGHIDLYVAADDGPGLHEVWLYTEADCAHISWTLGEQSHSELLSCGETTAFMSVPSGVHYTVIEGCGKRIAAYLTIESDMHLVIRARDLGVKESCTDEDQIAVGYDYGVELVESEKRISLITEL
jgi:hypothetical protein